MRKFGLLFASVFFAAATAQAQEIFPDPPIMVNTPSGQQVPVSLPATPAASGQLYTATTQPVVIPVPITLNVSPNVVQRTVPYTIPVPTPIVVQQPAPVQPPVFPQLPPQPQAADCPSPVGACVPVDGRGPLPFDIPTTMPGERAAFADGPVTSTVLRPPGIIPDFQQPNFQQMVPATNPLIGQGMPFPDPQQQLIQQQQLQQQQLLQQQQQYYQQQQELLRQQQAQQQQMQASLFRASQSFPAQVVPPSAPLEPMTVPAPGVPYSLDAQGRPHYVQQPGTYQFPTPQQWPGYTPVNYNANAPQQQGVGQQLGYQTGQTFANTSDPVFTPQQAPVPADLNPTINPNLTNPNTPVQLVSQQQVQQAVAAGAPMLILDVRGDLVRDVIGHIPNDINVPLTPSETFPARVRNAIPNRNLPVVVYCNDGINSAQAANMMANMGYTVYLMGIYTGWGSHSYSPATCSSCPK